MKQGPLVVDVFRGETVESTHLVDAVVTDADGKLVEYYGDCSRLTFPRSAIKMAQALALMESGAAEEFQLSQKWISLACASHLGEKIHTEEVKKWLQKIDLDESAFECGAHYPYDEDTKFEMIRRGVKPTALHNNCSGKHCGMLTTARHYHESHKGYAQHDHPVQIRVRKILSELAGINYDLAPWGVDGCGIPTYAIPLDKLSVTMSNFLSESSLSKANSLRRQATVKILQAVTAEPDMISGTHGLCSRVSKVSQGRSFAKTGAEGVYVGLIPRKGIAFAIKVIDGATRAAELATLHLLTKHGGLSEAELRELDPLTTTNINNWAGLLVGRSKIRC